MLIPSLTRLRDVAIIMLCVFSVCGLSAASISSSKSTNVTIPDLGDWVYSRIDITGAPSGATVTGIDVSFDIIHAYSADIIVDLEVGSYSNSARLWNREGGSADNPSRTISTSAFNGLLVKNGWYLYAKDFDADDQGYIDSWTITIYYEDASPPSSPSLTSPGASSSPGTTITDFTPTFRWSSVSGATGADRDGEFKLYLDGILIDSATVGGTRDLSGEFYVGKVRIDSGFLHGTVDEIRIYVRALDDTEVGSL